MKYNQVITYNVPFEKKSQDRIVENVKTKLDPFKLETFDDDTTFRVSTPTTTSGTFTPNTAQTFNYVSINSDLFKDRDVSYWFATRVDEVQNADAFTYTLELDVVATFGADIFSNMNGKEVYIERMHQDRYIADDQGFDINVNTQHYGLINSDFKISDTKGMKLAYNGSGVMVNQIKEVVSGDLALKGSFDYIGGAGPNFSRTVGDEYNDGNQTITFGITDGNNLTVKVGSTIIPVSIPNISSYKEEDIQFVLIDKVSLIVSYKYDIYYKSNYDLTASDIVLDETNTLLGSFNPYYNSEDERWYSHNNQEFNLINTDVPASLPNFMRFKINGQVITDAVWSKFNYFVMNNKVHLFGQDKTTQEYNLYEFTNDIQSEGSVVNSVDSVLFKEFNDAQFITFDGTYLITASIDRNSDTITFNFYDVANGYSLVETTTLSNGTSATLSDFAVNTVYPITVKAHNNNLYLTEYGEWNVYGIMGGTTTFDGAFNRFLQYYATNSTISNSFIHDELIDESEDYTLLEDEANVIHKVYNIIKSQDKKYYVYALVNFLGEPVLDEYQYSSKYSVLRSGLAPVHMRKDITGPNTISTFEKIGEKVATIVVSPFKYSTLDAQNGITTEKVLEETITGQGSTTEKAFFFKQNDAFSDMMDVFIPIDKMYSFGEFFTIKENLSDFVENNDKNNYDKLIRYEVGLHNQDISPLELMINGDDIEIDIYNLLNYSGKYITGKWGINENGLFTSISINKNQYYNWNENHTLGYQTDMGATYLRNNKYSMDAQTKGVELQGKLNRKQVEIQRRSAFSGGIIGGVMSAVNPATWMAHKSMGDLYGIYDDIEANEKQKIQASAQDANAQAPNTKVSGVEVLNRFVSNELTHKFNWLKKMPNDILVKKIYYFIQKYGYKVENWEQFSSEIWRSRSEWNYLKIESLEDYVDGLSFDNSVLNEFSMQLARGIRIHHKDDLEINYTKPNPEVKLLA